MIAGGRERADGRLRIVCDARVLHLYALTGEFIGKRAHRMKSTTGH